jgi:hypothetical protein
MTVLLVYHLRTRHTVLTFGIDFDVTTPSSKSITTQDIAAIRTLFPFSPIIHHAINVTIFKNTILLFLQRIRAFFSIVCRLN